MSSDERPVIKGLDCFTDRQLQDLLEAAKARADTKIILDLTVEIHRRRSSEAPVRDG